MARCFFLGAVLYGLLGVLLGPVRAEDVSRSNDISSVEERLSKAKEAYEITLRAEYEASLRGLPPSGWEPVVLQFLELAREGSTEAQETLGDMYDYGVGVDFDRCEATYWWDKAARAGRAKAQAHLGLAYSIGNGVVRDSDLAYLWLMTAAKNGDSDAAESARFIAESIIGDARRIDNLNSRLEIWRAEDQPDANIVRVPNIIIIGTIFAIIGIEPCHRKYNIY